MPTAELDRLRAENKRLRELLAWSDRERRRIENLACETLADLVEEIGWTIDFESLELAEAASTAFSIALHAPAHRIVRRKEEARG